MSAMEALKLCVLVYCVTAELSDQLRYFETLHHVDVKVRRKRSIDGHDSGTRDFSFTAFGKSFNLVLQPGSPVISADFRAKLVYKNGQTVPLYVNENDFFTGHLAENENIKADAFVEDGQWTASIYDTTDIYTLEPSWRYLPPSDNHSMIVYRHSDIRWDNTFPDLDKMPNGRNKFCRGIHPEDTPGYSAEWMEEADERSETVGGENSARSRRDVSAQNTCHIMAVADYTYFMGPGGGFPHRTANNIIQTMQRVNTIYRGTEWSQESALAGLGFQIKELRIHTELTDSSNYHHNGKHYNMYDGGTHWDYSELLEQFGRDKDVSKFCLAHLFTFRKFSGGVLGLAYIAGARKSSVGGICSARRGSQIAYNIGFSSSMNTKGYNLLSQESMLVTAHGHNWGAEHDAETNECAPDAFNNGRFIMYPYAVSGYDENNDQFSPCSKRYIAAALAARSELCFTAEETTDSSHTPNVPLCGNGIIDKDEDCDSGGMGLSGLDSCCSASCKFIGNATCSSINFECCKECRMAPANTLCRGSSRELCQEAAFCTCGDPTCTIYEGCSGSNFCLDRKNTKTSVSGLSLYCPSSTPLADDTLCIDEGKCFAGQCLDYCAYAGRLTNQILRPCRCENVATSCLRCCRSLDEPCKPLNSSGPESYLQDGRPCNYGYCEAGRCQKTSANMIQRLFNFIEHLDSSTFVAFMKSNIVGTVLIFSLVVWIPLSWTISCIDKRNEKKSKEQEQLLLAREAALNQPFKSNVLARPLKDYKVKTSIYRRTPRPDQLGYEVPEDALSQPHHQRTLEAARAFPRTHHPPVETKYKFYHKPDSPSLIETMV